MKLYRVETVIVSYVVAETKDEASMIARRDAMDDTPIGQTVTEATQKSIISDGWSNAEPWPEVRDGKPQEHTVEWYCDWLNGK